jgi:hypothetical protein
VSDQLSRTEDSFPVKTVCQIRDVPRSSYYDTAEATNDIVARGDQS